MKSLLPSVLLLSVAGPWLAASCSSQSSTPNGSEPAPSAVPSVTSTASTSTSANTAPPATQPASGSSTGPAAPGTCDSAGCAPVDSTTGGTATPSDGSNPPVVDSSGSGESSDTDAPNTPVSDVEFSVPSGTFDVTSDIPLIIMEAYGGGELPTQAGADKVLYRDLGFMLFEPVDGVAAISEPPTWVSRSGYHVRGQSSASFPKTPYRVELWDENNEDLHKPMIGMPADSDWAMIGEYSDKTLVRNAFSFSLAVEMGLNAPEMRFAEVYINQDLGPLEAADYQGVYAVTETIKNKSDRLDLKQLKPNDTEEAKLSGGYIFKFDMAALREDEGEIEIPCTGDQDTCFEDLELTDPVEPNAEQLAWISDYVSQAHATLVAEPIGDYAQYLDVKSFVDILVLNELTKGGDKYVRSVYLHKDRDQLITAGPAWDYNFTLGNLVNDVEGWQVDSGRDPGANWFQQLFAQPEIRAAMAARWAELRPSILSDAAIEARIDAVATPIVNAGPRDLELWPVTAGGVFGGGGGQGGGQGGAMDPGEPVEGALTWPGHIDEMKVWIRERTAWLDAEYAGF